MHRGSKKPASYHAMSPKLLNSLVIAGVAVPRIVRSYRGGVSSTLLAGLRIVKYQRDKEDSESYSQHSWNDHFSWRVIIIVLDLRSRLDILIVLHAGFEDLSLLSRGNC